MSRNNSNDIINRNLESENDNKIDELSDKISELKSISLDIRDYMNNESKLLKNMDNDYDNSTNLMGATMKKVDQILNAKTGRISCYLVLIILIFFSVLYFLS